MHIFCILISFVFVNVSTDELTDYKREVFITNAHIQLAHNMNNFTVENKLIANGLEHVITQIVVDEDCEARVFGYQLSEIVFFNIMFAVPEHYAYLYTLEEAILIQKTLQNIITNKLGIPVPVVLDQKFENLVLTQLGKERRSLTAMALKYIMSHALGFENKMPNLLEERRILTAGAIENRIARSVADGHKPKATLLGMCRLIALFASIQFPESFIKNVEARDKKICFLEDEITANKIYREIDGVWWQVNANAVDDRLQLLKEQLFQK